MNPYQELIDKAASVIQEVMEAGERQCIKSGKDPEGWRNYKPLDRINHALKHLLNVWHHQNPELLTHDTALRELSHALVGILMVLTNLDRESVVGLVVDITEQELVE